MRMTKMRSGWVIAGLVVATGCGVSVTVDRVSGGSAGQGGSRSAGGGGAEVRSTTQKTAVDSSSSASGTQDAGVLDSGVDSGAIDSGILGAGLGDSGVVDSGADGGAGDSGSEDSGALDAPGEVVCGDTTCTLDSGLPECCIGTVGRALSTTACVSGWAACHPQGDYITMISCDEDSDCAPDAGCYEFDSNEDVYSVQCCSAEDLYTISFNNTYRYVCQTPSTALRACPAGTTCGDPWPIYGVVLPVGWKLCL
jgi:hypothetical protein